MRTTPTDVVEALICLPPMQLVLQSEARSAVYRLWSMACCSYLHPISFSPGRYVTVFQAEIYAILAGVHEIQLQNSPERYVSIWSDSQAALKALQAVRTTSPLVQQCQKALNNISTRHVVGLYWVPGHAGERGHEIADELARGGSVLGWAASVVWWLACWPLVPEFAGSIPTEADVKKSSACLPSEGK
jgi:hypothetical protein